MVNLYKVKFKVDFADQGQKVSNVLIEERIKEHCSKFSDSGEYHLFIMRL